MEFLNEIKSLIPDYAKDIRLNLDSVVGRSALEPADSVGTMLAAAFAAKSKTLIEAIRNSGQLNETDVNGALTAAALMGMNNVWYPYVEMANDEDLKTQRPELRMNAYATYGGLERRRFEMFALAASIIGKCHFCVAAHYSTLKELGVTAVQLRDVGRIAAVVMAAAQVVAAEGK